MFAKGFHTSGYEHGAIPTMDKQQFFKNIFSVHL